MKLVLFTLPDNVNTDLLIRKLNTIFTDLGFSTNVHLFEQTDLKTTTIEKLPVMIIIDNLIKVCGTESTGLMNFTANFWNAVSDGLGGNKKDVISLLNEIVKNEDNPLVKSYAKAHYVNSLFTLAKQALGMLR